MSDKHYVGLDITGFEDNGKTRPISRVTLKLDDENVITAGDDTGMELLASCAHGTQAMANAILERMKGYQYQMFSADAANIDPAAELGDGVTVGGVYGVVSRFSDDGSGYPGITAPGEAELEDEYPSTGPLTQEFNRKIAQTRSYITKTAEEIKLGIEDEISGLSSSFTTQLDSLTGRVDGLNGEFGEFKLTVEGFTVTGPDGTTRIKGSSIETESIAAGSIRADQVQLTGSISWGDLDSSAQGQVTAAQSAAATASQNASAALSAAATAQATVDSVVSYDYQGRTYIDGNKILTGTVTASTIQGGTVELLDYRGYSVGSMTLTQGSAASGGYAVELNSTGGLRLSASGQFWVDSLNGSFGMVGGGFQIQANCIPRGGSYSGTYSLGASGAIWSAVYAATGQIITSDANRKHDIADMPDKYLDMLLYLTPKVFRLNDGTSGRLHVGFIAQEVEEAMAACGIDPVEFGGFVRDVDESGTEILMLRYEEFIPIIWGALQRRL